MAHVSFIISNVCYNNNFVYFQNGDRLQVHVKATEDISGFYYTVSTHILFNNLFYMDNEVPQFVPCNLVKYKACILLSEKFVVPIMSQMQLTVVTKMQIAI